MTDAALVERLRNYAKDWRDRAASKDVVDEAADALDEACGYAERLAVILWEKHWRDDVPQWKPLTGDLIGILTQIDNAASVLVRAEKAHDDTLEKAAKVAEGEEQFVVATLIRALKVKP